MSQEHSKRKFQFKILDKRAAKGLTRGTSKSAGYDLIACINEPLTLKKGDDATFIPLGFACYMDDGGADVAGFILPRSGLGHKQGLCLGNMVGLIDKDFQNQWLASAWNRGQKDEIIINPGDKIAQAVFIEVVHPEFVFVEEFSEATERGLGGFGSTGGHASLNQ